MRVNMFFKLVSIPNDLKQNFLSCNIFSRYVANPHMKPHRVWNSHSSCDRRWIRELPEQKSKCYNTHRDYLSLKKYTHLKNENIRGDQLSFRFSEVSKFHNNMRMKNILDFRINYSRFRNRQKLSHSIYCTYLEKNISFDWTYNDLSRQ